MWTGSSTPRSSYLTDIYEPATDINAAPIVMQSATPDTSDVSGEAARPSALIFDVRTADGVLYAYGGDTLLGTFSDLYVANQPKTNVGARIALGDTETANALASFVRENGAGNLWVISNAGDCHRGGRHCARRGGFYRGNFEGPRQYLARIRG